MRKLKTCLKAVKSLVFRLQGDRIGLRSRFQSSDLVLNQWGRAALINLHKSSCNFNLQVDYWEQLYCTGWCVTVNTGVEVQGVSFRMQVFSYRCTFVHVSVCILTYTNTKCNCISDNLRTSLIWRLIYKANCFDVLASPDVKAEKQKCLKDLLFTLGY